MEKTKWFVGWISDDGEDCGGVGVADTISGAIGMALANAIDIANETDITLTAQDIVNIYSQLSELTVVGLNEINNDFHINYYLEEIPYREV